MSEVSFAPTDWVTVAVFAVGSIAAIVGARLGRHSDAEAVRTAADDNLHAEMSKLRGYIHDTFIPRAEVFQLISQAREALEEVRQENENSKREQIEARNAQSTYLREQLSRSEDVLREDIRDLRTRVDSLIAMINEALRGRRPTR